MIPTLPQINLISAQLNSCLDRAPFVSGAGRVGR